VWLLELPHLHCNFCLCCAFLVASSNNLQTWLRKCSPNNQQHLNPDAIHTKPTTHHGLLDMGQKAHTKPHASLHKLCRFPYAKRNVPSAIIFNIGFSPISFVTAKSNSKSQKRNFNTALLPQQMPSYSLRAKKVPAHNFLSL